MKSTLSTRILAILAVCCLAALAACGKSGMPQPQDPKRNFSFAAVQANTTGNCLTITAQMEGAYKNLDRVRLELSPVNGPEDCPTCPFVADDVVLFLPSEAGLDLSEGTLTFSYCPSKAKAYRWRLLGVSRYSSIPHATSFVQYTEMAE